MAVLAVPGKAEKIRAGEEARAFGIEHYRFEVAEQPEIGFLGSNGSDLGSLRVDFGESPGEQTIAVDTPTAELTVDWRPAEGVFRVVDHRTGETAEKRLTDQGWKAERESQALLERFDTELAMTALAMAAYLRHIGHGAQDHRSDQD